MVSCFFACESASLVCCFFSSTEGGKKTSFPMRPLFFFSASLPCFQEEERKHLSGAVHSSNTSQVSHLRAVLRFMHIHNFLPSQDMEHKHRRKTAYIPHFFLLPPFLSALNPPRFPQKKLSELNRKLKGFCFCYCIKECKCCSLRGHRQLLTYSSI